MHSRTEYSLVPVFCQEIREKDPETKGTVVAEKETPAAEIVFIPAQPFVYTITLSIASNKKIYFKYQSDRDMCTRIYGMDTGVSDPMYSG